MSDGTSAGTMIAFLGDLSLGCTFAYKPDLEVRLSEERFFSRDHHAYRAKQRIDIVCRENGATQATRPIVGLKTAGS